VVIRWFTVKKQVWLVDIPSALYVRRVVSQATNDSFAKQQPRDRYE